MNKLKLVLPSALTILLIVCSLHLYQAKAIDSFPVYNVNTGLRYATIQSAINAIQTKDGHTIRVEAGIYEEEIIIDKGVKIIGENSVSTKIYGDIHIISPNVTITNFSINGVVSITACYCNVSYNIISGGILLGKGYYGGGSLYALYCIIQNNTIMNGELAGINVYHAKNCSIIWNKIYNNSVGIALCFYTSSYSYDTTSHTEYFEVRGNLIYNNHIGIALYGRGHVIIENSVYNNSYALWLTPYATENLIYHNNFFDNEKQISLPYREAANYWDNGYEGNYWDDYTGTDENHDGIGDTPYVIDLSNQDNFPLMNPYIIPEFSSIIPFLSLFIILTALILYQKSVNDYALSHIDTRQRSEQA